MENEIEEFVENGNYGTLALIDVSTRLDRENNTIRLLEIHLNKRQGEGRRCLHQIDLDQQFPHMIFDLCSMSAAHFFDHNNLDDREQLFRMNALNRGHVIVGNQNRDLLIEDLTPHR